MQIHNDSNIDYSRPLSPETFQSTLDRYPIGARASRTQDQQAKATSDLAQHLALGASSGNLTCGMGMGSSLALAVYPEQSAMSALAKGQPGHCSRVSLASR